MNVDITHRSLLMNPNCPWPSASQGRILASPCSSLAGVSTSSRTRNTSAVCADLEKIHGLEIHSRTDDGCLIITLDEPDNSKAADVLLNLGNLDGVLSTSLVYNNFDDDFADEECTQ